jgi:hypothetical protein
MIHHAAVTVCEAGYGSSFVIGKKLGIGYNRSRMLIEALQEAGILGEFDLETRRWKSHARRRHPRSHRPQRLSGRAQR